MWCGGLSHVSSASGCTVDMGNTRCGARDSKVQEFGMRGAREAQAGQHHVAASPAAEADGGSASLGGPEPETGRQSGESIVGRPVECVRVGRIGGSRKSTVTEEGGSCGPSCSFK